MSAGASISCATISSTDAPSGALRHVDNVSKVSPAIEATFSLRGGHVVAVPDQLKAGGLPERLAVDNGPESISKALDAWAYHHGVTLEFSRTGKPTDNAFAGSFNRHFRQECLDRHRFVSPEEARQVIEAWRMEYNTERPHRALKQRTPATFVEELKVSANISDGRTSRIRSRRSRHSPSAGRTGEHIAASEKHQSIHDKALVVNAQFTATAF